MTNPNFYNCSLLSDADLYEIFAKRPHDGIYLVPGRSGKGWFHSMIGYGAAVLFLRGENIDGVLIAIGNQFGAMLENQKHLGFLVRTHRESTSNGN